ncbi:hypothetical protein V3C99_014560 [Haemonchus contortus]|uniref:CsbD family protein n=1 Tax=Haemonchus contortus TaxID=6289 RepID=A0A7I4YUD9_HAECO|nr:unknown [Haemonchus contortus]
MSYNETTAMRPAEELRLVGGPRNRFGRYEEPDSNQGQDFGSAAKEKLHDAGQAIKHTAENIGDKAGELKDKAMNKIQEGADAIKSH